jgi:hypothetical protein
LIPGTVCNDALCAKGGRSEWHQKAIQAAEGGELASLIRLWLATGATDRLVEYLRKAN